MDVDLFDFELPETSIALRPVVPRDASKLMVVDGNTIKDHNFSELSDLLRPGDALVFNNTKVIPARFSGTRNRNGVMAQVSVTLHRRVDDDRWIAFVKGAKKLAIGEKVEFGGRNGACDNDKLGAEVIRKDDGGQVEFSFELSGPFLDERMIAIGDMPLPPYIASKRKEDTRDLSDYQTIYAAHDGAVAAPTAGLHFTQELMEQLAVKNISSHFVTLHVGAGTFLPVKSDDTDEHIMHYENGVIDEATAEALNMVRANCGRIVCVGTTSLRLLESAVDAEGKLASWQGATDIFITPGKKITSTDMLITNFHLPRSTLFMLVSAFCGLAEMHAAYSYAIKNNYRFYSYGDASLLYLKRP